VVSFFPLHSNSWREIESVVHDMGKGLRDIGRLNAFTDGVFVVSMTLLVLDVRFPDNVAGLDGRQLLAALVQLWPKYFSYALSFVVIARYWMGYTLKFGRMERVTEGFAWLNILLLLVVGVIPFTTSLISSNSGYVATMVYAATMAVLSSLLVVMWSYAVKNGLVESKWPPGHQWRDVIAWLQIAAVFVVSIVIAPYDERVAKLVWLLLLIPADRMLQRTVPKID
jgi:uncharacterized membrane protein